jgi:hypothetical protein
MKVILLLLIFAVQAFACPVDRSVIESMKSRPHFKSMVISDNGLTEKDFRSLISRVRKVYDPMFEARGYAIEYLLYWDVDEGNAMTTEAADPKKVWFMFSGGLLRGRYTTKDSFLFIACHEIGHHMGGFPKEGGDHAWCSTEGEADYFANLKCMKEILRGDPENAAVAAKVDLPWNIKRRCREMYSDEDSVNICLRSTKAAEDGFKFLQSKERNWADADSSLFNQILAPVDSTIMRYPDHACRAETAYRGAICSREGEISDTDEAVGVCHMKNGDKFGERPRCWFKPGVEG